MTAIGIGIGVPFCVAKAGAVAPWTPASLPSQVGRWDSLSGITLGGTLMGFGTSPPVITLTATPGTPTAMLLDCPLGGARGVATLRHSFDNGATWSSAQVTAASMTFGGFSATVANTTFTTDNTWNTTVATWANQGGTGDPTMATAANQPLYVYDASFACPVVKGLMSAAARLISASGGITVDSAFTLYSVGRFVTTSALAAHAAIGNSSTALQGSYVGYTAADLAVY